QPDVVQELGRVDGWRIGDVEDVLVPDLELGRQEKARGIAKIDVKDDRDDRARERSAIDAEGRCDLASLATIDEDRSGIGLRVGQTGGLCSRFGEGDSPGVKGELTLTTGRAERHEGKL